jgi:phosphate transport system substrate-binding protein
VRAPELSLIKDAEDAMDTLMTDARWEMAQVRGRCTNTDYCSLGDGRGDILVNANASFVCPECSKPLRPSSGAATVGRLRRLAGYGAAGALLVTGATLAGYGLSAPSPPRAPLVAPDAATQAAVAPKVQTPAQTAVADVANAQAVVSKPIAPPIPRVIQAIATAQAVAPPAVTAPSKPEFLLRLAGSSAFASSLVPKLAEAYLTAQGNVSVTADHGTTGDTQVSSLHSGEQQSISVATRDPAGWLGAMAAGQIDVALSTVQVSPQDATAGLSEHAVAVEAAAVIVNPANTIATLTLHQLRGVLDGSIRSWARLGATSDAPIHLILPADGSAERLGALVPGVHGLPSDVRLVGDVAAAVANDPDAVALTHPIMAGEDRTIAVDAGISPVAPTAAAIVQGSYPLAQKIYLYTPANGASPSADRFVGFALSDAGQSIVSAAGLVPVAYSQSAPQVSPAAATPRDQYNQLLASATRLDADLHFETNSNKLDLHSAKAVDRISNFMFSYHNPPDHLVVVGFADNQGTPEANRALSLGRANAVAALFKQRGLPPGLVINLGSDLPIADNGTESGREKNRRVEVFLKN